MYADKFKIETPKLMKRFWGDQFYSAKEKKWNKTGGEGYVRGFCQFVLDPIFKVSHFGGGCYCLLVFVFVVVVVVVVLYLLFTIDGVLSFKVKLLPPSMLA